MKAITSILSAEDVEGEQHGVGEGGGFLLAGKVEAVDLPGIPPLVEGWGSLVVLETLHDGVVNNHLRAAIRIQGFLFRREITA